MINENNKFQLQRIRWIRERWTFERNNYKGEDKYDKRKQNELWYLKICYFPIKFFLYLCN